MSLLGLKGVSNSFAGHTINKVSDSTQNCHSYSSNFTSGTQLIESSHRGGHTSFPIFEMESALDTEEDDQNEFELGLYLIPSVIDAHFEKCYPDSNLSIVSIPSLYFIQPATCIYLLCQVFLI